MHDSELHLYNKINIENVDINTRTVAVFRALPTCIAQKSCGECARLRHNSNFGCAWCEASGHCSDGADRLRQAWDDHMCHLANTTTCQSNGEGHTEWRHSTDDTAAEPSPAQAATATSTVVSAVVSSLMVVILIFILFAFLYVYGKYNENTVIGRQVKVLHSSYHQFGDKTTSLELGKKKAAQDKKGAASEFVNPHPMATNNNVITASM